MTTVAFFLLGFALRLGMWLGDKSPWSDEWFSIMLAQKPFVEVVQGAIRDVHPPLYFILLHAMSFIPGDALWAFRLWSFLPGVGLLVVLYFLTKEVSERKTAAGVLFFAAISPYWLQTANEIRSYSLLSFMTILASFCLVKASKEPGAARWMRLYFLTAVLAAYIEHVAWFWLSAATAYLVHLFFKERRAGKLPRFHRWVLFISAPALLLTVYQAFFGEAFFDFERIREYLPPLIFLKKTVGIFWHFSCGYTYSMITTEVLKDQLRSSVFFWLSAVTTLSALFFVGDGFLRLWKARRAEATFFATALMLPLVVLGVFYSVRLDARYLSFAAPFYFIFLGLGVSSARPWARTGFLILFTVVNGFGAFRALSSPTDAVHREDYKSMLRRVVQDSGERDAVVGKRLPVAYYRKALGWKFKGPYFPEPHDFFIENRRDFDRVWMMDSVNMHPKVTDRQLEGTLHKMETLGYRLSGNPVLFGGPDALTRLYIFEREGISNDRRS